MTTIGNASDVTIIVHFLAVLFLSMEKVKDNN